MQKKINFWLSLICICVVVMGNIMFPIISYATEATELEDDLSFEILGPVAMLADVDTGEVIYEKNVDEIKFPASITKLMTAMLVLDVCEDLDAEITISEEAYIKGQVNASDAGLQVGQVLSVRECLYGMLVVSGNEFAYALAEYTGSLMGGDVNTFVEAMNMKAETLGCTNTNFTNPCGLHDDMHYTTARDMTYIAIAAWNYPELMDSVSARYFSPNHKAGSRPNLLENTHKMLVDDEYLYDEFVGGKTGYTDEAGYTLVTYASYNGRNLVCVVLGEDENNQYKDTTSLFNYAFGINDGCALNEELDAVEEGQAFDLENSGQVDGKKSDYIQLFNLDTGEVIYTRGANEKVAAGGLVGMVAALTALDYCGVDENVTVTEITGKSGKITTNTYTVGLCLYKIMYDGSSSCMGAISNMVEARTGTVPYSFVKLMNKKAIEIGCENTNFDDLTGLYEKYTWTSAADTAKIFKAVYDNDVLKKIVTDSNADIKTSLFSGGTSIVTYDTKDGITLGCVILKGDYTLVDNEADQLLEAGFDYYSKGKKVEYSFEWERYGKYIQAVVALVAYIALLIVLAYTIKKKTKIHLPEVIGTVIANLMLAVLIIGSALYLHNKLEDVTFAKSYFIAIATAIFVVLYMTMYVLRGVYSTIHNFKWYDVLLAIYLSGGLVSVIMRNAIDDAMFASYGRYTGYITDIVYVLILCLAIICGKRYKLINYAIPVVSIPLGVLAVLNHYNVDPLNVYQGYEADNLNRFISTIGNVDMFAVFMGVAFAYCGMLFCKEKNKIGIGIAFLATIVAQISIIVCSANGGYIGLIVFYILAPVFMRNRWQFYKYLCVLETFFASVFGISYAEKELEVYMPLDSISQKLVDSSFSAWAFIIITVLLCLLAILFMIIQDMNVAREIARVSLYTTYGVMVVWIILIIVYANRAEYVDPDSIASFMVFGREWGSQRGYIWSMAVSGFGELSVSEKLFGIGSSNVARLFWTQINPLDNGIVQMIDNAHCEYIQVLITHGIVGLVSLYGWIVLSVVNAVKKLKQDENMAIYVIAVIAYMASAVIGLNVVYVVILLIVNLSFLRMK